MQPNTNVISPTETISNLLFFQDSQTFPFVAVPSVKDLLDFDASGIEGVVVRADCTAAAGASATLQLFARSPTSGVVYPVTPAAAASQLGAGSQMIWTAGPWGGFMTNVFNQLAAGVPYAGHFPVPLSTTMFLRLNLPAAPGSVTFSVYVEKLPFQSV